MMFTSWPAQCAACQLIPCIRWHQVLLPRSFPLHKRGDLPNGKAPMYPAVRFSDEGDQQRALLEMQGVYCGKPPNADFHRDSQVAQQGQQQMMPPPVQAGMNYLGVGGPLFYQQGFNPMAAQPMNQFTDPNNTTVFVGGLSGYVTEDELRSFFQGFREITTTLALAPRLVPLPACAFWASEQRDDMRWRWSLLWWYFVWEESHVWDG
ncbi:uncharacterized protein E0L32_006011 [Thyridium curvatum]|uniref:RRM domain-containing protein n=1 Tax=Thyridium curvatum TaxID=1093900 RepID=A0A507BAC3_9PEZI|nr:uncharacterized protein E0L32_006011 [Thyridium curvatum]TPX13540.1 hypothetical protein E0L32_006011 [Thyridium curvatum]